VVRAAACAGDAAAGNTLVVTYGWFFCSANCQFAQIVQAKGAFYTKTEQSKLTVCSTQEQVDILLKILYGKGSG